MAVGLHGFEPSAGFGPGGRQSPDDSGNCRRNRRRMYTALSPPVPAALLYVRHHRLLLFMGGRPPDTIPPFPARGRVLCSPSGGCRLAGFRLSVVVSHPDHSPPPARSGRSGERRVTEVVQQALSNDFTDTDRHSVSNQAAKDTKYHSLPCLQNLI